MCKKTKTGSLSTEIYKIIFQLKTKLKPIAKLITNKKIRNIILYVNSSFSSYTFKRTMLKYYNGLSSSQIDSDIKKVVEFLKHNKSSLFPYEFTKKYSKLNVEVLTDLENGLRYVYLDAKKLYFKRSYDEAKIKSVFSALLMEQDPESPHLYLTEDFNLSEDDILADIGAAEGEFSLRVVDKVKKIYLFEYDPESIEALKATFEPWKNKVQIIGKYVSDDISNSHTTLDNFFAEENPSFIKVDVEGAELDLLHGAKKILSSKSPMKFITASYHRHNDEITLRDELIKYGFETGYSKGYMLSIWDDILKEPYLRRGIIRAKKS